MRGLWSAAALGGMVSSLVGSQALAVSPTIPAPPAADSASVPQPILSVGDGWVYDRTFERGTTGFSQKRLDLEIHRVGSDTMAVGIKEDGAPGDFQDHITGLDWSQRRIVDGQQTVTGRPFAFPLTVGKTWTADYVDPNRHGRQTYAHFKTTYKVVGWEDVTVPAGTFRALKVEANGTIEAKLAPAVGAVSGAVAMPGDATTVTHTQTAGPQTTYAEEYNVFYYSPKVKYFVKTSEEQYDSNNIRTSRDSQALVSYKPAS